MSNKRSESVMDLAETFLHCRDKGHHWQHLTDEITLGTKQRVRAITRHWDCKGCGTKQEECIQLPRCEVVSRRYIYPDGYLIGSRPDVAATRVSDVRRELFGRAGIKF